MSPARPPAPASLKAPLSYLASTRLLVNTVERFVYPFLPVLARGLGISLQQAGLLVTLRAAAGFTAPFTVAAAGRHGRDRRVTIVALALLVAGLVVVSGATGFFAGAAGFVLLGMGRPAYDASAQAYLADRTPYTRRARVLSVLELTYAGGLLVGAPVAGWLIDRGSWRTPFLVFAVVGALALVLAPRILESGAVDVRRERGRLHLTRPARALLITLLLTTLGAETSLIVFGAWLEDSLGLSVVALGGMAVLIGGAELTGEFVTLTLADRLGKRRMVAVGLATASLGFVSMAGVVTAPMWGLAAFAIALFGFEIAIVAAIPLASEAVPSARARFLAIAAMALGGGRAIAGSLGPWAFERWGPAGNAAISGLCYALALAVLLREVPEHPEEPVEPAADRG